MWVGEKKLAQKVTSPLAAIEMVEFITPCSANTHVHKKKFYPKRTTLLSNKDNLIRIMIIGGMFFNHLSISSVSVNLLHVSVHPNVFGQIFLYAYQYISVSVNASSMQ